MARKTPKLLNMKLADAHRSVNIVQLSGEIICTLPVGTTVLQAEDHVLDCLGKRYSYTEAYFVSGSDKVQAMNSNGNPRRLVDVVKGDTLQVLIQDCSPGATASVWISWEALGRRWLSCIPEAYVDLSPDDTFDDALFMMSSMDGLEEPSRHLVQVGVDMWARRNLADPRMLHLMCNEGFLERVQNFSDAMKLPLHELCRNTKPEAFLVYDFTRPSRALLFESQKSLMAFAERFNMIVNTEADAEFISADPEDPWILAWQSFSANHP